MRDVLWTKGFVIGLIILFIGANVLPNIKGEFQEQEKIMMWYINGPSTPLNTSNTIVDRNSLNLLNPSAVVLNNVPTSTWTYGCTATAVGMLFGYYDRIGYSNMYTGPDNSGVCPLTNLGQGIGTPIPGSCYIIATQNGLDGISSKAHVDDYWISINSPGPDPWENHWPEHTWSLCVADFIGTNQWKWDTNSNGNKDANYDGGTTYYYNTSGSKLYDFIPPSSYGLPQTEVGHGCKLFAQSRGYTVTIVYNQLTNTPSGNPHGFTFGEFQAEINAGRPVLTHWTSSSVGHTMLGVGYDVPTNTIYFHDTWDNNLHQCTWTGAYSGYGLLLKAVTVMQLANAPNAPPDIPSNPNPTNGATGIDKNADLGWVCSDPDGDPLTYDIYFGTASIPPLVASGRTSMSYDPGTMSDGSLYYWRIVAKDNRGGLTTGPIWDFRTIIRSNNPPNTPSNPDPPNQAKDVDLNTSLSWTGGDPDAGDTVMYDVYFGSMMPLQKVASNISTTSYNPGNLANRLTYYWNIVAWDNHGSSAVSPGWHFTTINATNNPPNKPSKPSGPTNGKLKQEYTYTTSTTDPENDQMYYLWDWGDGNNSGWIGPFPSGATASVNYKWTVKGSYSIKVKAKDIYGKESNWSDPLPITMPYSFNNPILQFLEWLFQRFPHAFPVLRHMLGY